MSVTSMSVTSMSVTSMNARLVATPSLTARNWDSMQFRAIFALSFLVYLPIMMAARLTPAFWRHAASRRSILAEAIEAAGTTAEIAFYG